MKSNLIALAVTALVGGLLVLPLTHQSALAQAYAGLKALGSSGGTSTNGTTTPMTGTNNDRGEVILVGRGGRGGGGHGGGRGGGRSFGGGHHGGGKAFSGGGHRGGGKAYRGGGHRGGSYAYRGGKSHGYRGRGYAYHDGKGHKGKNHGHYNKGHYRYYRYGRYYRNYGWYGPYVYGYGYGGCAWLRQQALITGSQYWWDRYYACIY